MTMNCVTLQGLAFMADRAIRKPSPHTTKSYRQNFGAIATLLALADSNLLNRHRDASLPDIRLRSS